MTLRTMWRVIARWKWIVIPGLILALGAGGALFMRTPKTYTVEASYLFLSPVLDTKGVASNPFLQLGNGVSQAVDVLAVSLTDGQTVRTFTKTAPKLTYTAARDQSVAAPLMVISVEDVNRATAATTLASLGDILGERLNAMQEKAGAPPVQWITMTKLTSDPKPVIGYAEGVRNGLLAFAAAMLVVFLLVAIAERIRVRVIARRERKRAQAVPEPDTEPAAEPDAGAEVATPEAEEPLDPDSVPAVPAVPAEPVAAGADAPPSRDERRRPSRPSRHDTDDLEDVLNDDPLSNLRS